MVLTKAELSKAGALGIVAMLWVVLVVCGLLQGGQL